MAFADKLREEIDAFYNEEVLYGADEEDALYEAIERFKPQIIQLGKSEADDFVDDLGHLNTTHLGEWLADVLHLYYPDTDDIPDNVFEIAFEIGEMTGLNEEF